MAPASAAASRPSGKGKKASDAADRALGARLGQPAALAASSALMRGDAGEIDPAHLAGADAGGGAVLGIDDGVGLHMLGDGEGEQHVGDLLLGRLALGHDLQLACRRRGRCRAICTRKPPATERRSGPARAGSGRPPVDQQAQVLLRADDLRGFGVGFGRDDHFGEDLGDLLAPRRASSVRLNAMMPPKAETGSQASARR